jgi:ribosomal protein L11
MPTQDNKHLVKHIKKIYLRSQSADPAPPLGTVLGNLGVIQILFVLVLIYILKICLLIFL